MENVVMKPTHQFSPEALRSSLTLQAQCCSHARVKLRECESKDGAQRPARHPATFNLLMKCQRSR